MPLLSRLFEQAVARVMSRRGGEEASALAARVARLHQAAREAHAAGDLETAGKRMQGARMEAARAVTQVFPGAAERVIAAVSAGVVNLNARIATSEAEGKDVTRPRDIARMISRLLASAAGELAEGRSVGALVHATPTADLLTSLRNRCSTSPARPCKAGAP